MMNGTKDTRDREAPLINVYSSIDEIQTRVELTSSPLPVSSEERKNEEEKNQTNKPLTMHTNTGQSSISSAIEEIFDGFEETVILKAKNVFQEEYSDFFKNLLNNNNNNNEKYMILSKISSNQQQVLIEELVDRIENVNTELNAAYSLLAICLDLNGYNENRKQQILNIQYNNQLLLRNNIFSILIDSFQRHVSSHSSESMEKICLFANILYIMMVVLSWESNEIADYSTYEQNISEMQHDLLNKSRGSMNKHFINFCIDILKDSILSSSVEASNVPFKKILLLFMRALTILLGIPESKYDKEETTDLHAKTKIKQKDVNFFKYKYISTEESSYSLAAPIVEAISIINSQEPKLLPTEEQKRAKVESEAISVSRYLIEDPTNAEYLYQTTYNDLPPLVLCLIRLIVACYAKDFKGILKFKDVKQNAKAYAQTCSDESYKPKSDKMRHKQIILKSSLTILFTLIKQWRKDGHPMQSMNLCQLLIDGNSLQPLLDLIKERDIIKLLGEPAFEIHMLDKLRGNRFVDGQEDTFILNWNHMYISVTALRIIQKATKGLFYGIVYLINSEAHERLYQLLCKLNHKACPLFVTYASKILKNLIPYISIEWRTRHKEVLGWVYLNVELTLCDTWLLVSKRGINTLVGEAKKQIAERRLRIEKFNSSNYERWWENMNQYVEYMKHKCLLDASPFDYPIYSSVGELIGTNHLTQLYNSIEITLTDCVNADLL
jgi:hypothetical protein